MIWTKPAGAGWRGGGLKECKRRVSGEHLDRCDEVSPLTRHRKTCLLCVDRPPSSLLPSSDCLNADVDSPTIRSQPDTDEKADKNRHQSEGIGGDLREAAARICGQETAVIFGPEREKQFYADLCREVAALANESLGPDLFSGDPAFVGGEHLVWEREEDIVPKRTKCGFYGRMMDEKAILDPSSFQMPPRLYLRNARPSEYLLRWAIVEDIFGLKTTYLGCLPNAKQGPQIGICQPYIAQDEADPATPEDVEGFMTAHGFEHVDRNAFADQSVASATWYRQRDGILIADAYARNFRKDLEGYLVPIDLMVTLVPKGASQILPEPDAPWHPGTPPAE